MAVDLLTMTKAEAAAAGLKKFFSGSPCRRGHFGLSWVKEGGCVVCWSGRTHLYRQQHQEHLQARDAARYAAQRDGKLAMARAYRKANPERARAAVKRHYQENKPRYFAQSAERRALKARSCPPWASRDAIAAIYAEAARMTQETGVQHDVDHEIPLRGCCVSGLHVPWNLRVMPASENRAKGNRWGCINCEKR